MKSSKTIRISNDTYALLQSMSYITGVPIKDIVDNIIRDRMKQDIVKQLNEKMKKEKK